MTAATALTAKEMARGLQLALDTTPTHSPYAWVNPDGLRDVIAFLRDVAAPALGHRCPLATADVGVRARFEDDDDRQETLSAVADPSHKNGETA